MKIEFLELFGIGKWHKVEGKKKITFELEITDSEKKVNFLI